LRVEVSHCVGDVSAETLQVSLACFAPAYSLRLTLSCRS
jgi:hypothetical protein